MKPFGLNDFGCSGTASHMGHETLRRRARNLLGEGAGDIRVLLAKIVDLAKPKRRALRNAAVSAMNEINGDLAALNDPIGIANLENYLLAQLLTLHSDACQEVVESDSTTVVLPRTIKRARDYIHARIHEKFTLEDLATYAGCSCRSLQVNFRKVFGVSPMEYLKVVRLEGIRNDLLNSDGRQGTVAEIARRWGFVHMGRFAKTYKDQFGVLPSDTLRQNK